LLYIIFLVYTFGETNEFPNFFTRSNVPIDKEDELETGNGQQIESIIRESLDRATKEGITGNKVTPFVLGEIRRQTGNKSIKTNQNLVYKNARIASQIAVALSLTKSDSSLSKFL
jgi:pseudouridine-5'-phosphate glycosidase